MMGKSWSEITKVTKAPRTSCVLLVVDDCAFMARLVARVLRGRFKTILLADCTVQADRTLRGNAVSHVVCDLHLGEDEPLGTELVRKWRTLYPTFRRAIVYSASDVSELRPGDGVDAVLAKSDDLSALAAALLPESISQAQ